MTDNTKFTWQRRDGWQPETVNMWKWHLSHQRCMSGISCQKTEKTDTLEDIIAQCENHMELDKDLTYTEARNVILTGNIKDRTWQNNGPDTTSDCTGNPHQL